MRGFFGNPVRILRSTTDVEIYRVDLTTWLAGDTLSTVELVESEGVTVDSVSIISPPLSIPDYGDIAASSALALKLSGGVAGVAGMVSVKVTAAGRERVVGYAILTL